MKKECSIIRDMLPLYFENMVSEDTAEFVKKHIGKLILQQLSVWFGLPIITAIIVAAIVIAYFIQTISAEISAYIGFGAVMLQIGATMGILAILLICYFISTWIIFRRSVNP